MKDLNGKVAVVTGAGSGIGRGLCRAFAAAGMRVVAADVDLAAAEGTRELVREHGGEARAVHTDVADRRSVEELAARVVAELGAVHLVCNNAGVFTGGPLLEMTEGDWRWLLSVNLMGVVHGCQVFAPRLAAQGDGHIVNTASVGGFLASDVMTIYCVTKYGVVALSEALRQALETKGVGVSVLCPGPVETGLPAADRLRPVELGPSGGTSAMLAPMTAGGLDPVEVGEMVIRGVRDNAEYIFTHGMFRDVIAQRFDRVLAAFDR